MHNPTEQDVLDLISVPSNHVDTSSPIINAYLNPEFQYNLQLTNLTNCLNSTTTTPIDLYWTTNQQTPPAIASQIVNDSTARPHRLADSRFPTNRSNLAALSQQDITINHQQYQQDPNYFDHDQQKFLLDDTCLIQPPTSTTTALKYHRSMSHIHPTSDHQQPVIPASSFNHRASLPNIYPVNIKTSKCNQNNYAGTNDKHGSNYKNIVHDTIDTNNDSSSKYYFNAIPLLTWNQSLGHSYHHHHHRPPSTLDDSTRKRTKSMDHINHKASNVDEQQQYQCYQHFTPFQTEYKELQQQKTEYQYLPQRQQRHQQQQQIQIDMKQQQKYHQQQEQHQQQQQQQQLQYESHNITITVDQSSAHSYAEERVSSTLNPSHQQQHSSPTIKSPMSAVSSISTISSNNTTKHVDDDLFDKDDKQHAGGDMGDSISGMIKEDDHYAGDYDINGIKNMISCSDTLDDQYTCQNPSNIGAIGALPSLQVEHTNDNTPKMDTTSTTSTTTRSRTSKYAISSSSSMSARSSSSPSSSTTSSSSSSSSSSSANTEYNYPILSEADMDAVTHDTSAIPRRQNPRYDADAYTPRWVRYTGQQKQGYCESCQPLGKWLQLKNSAYWYHKQFFHGISSVSGQPFTSPLEQRVNKESDLLEGLCHQCLQFVPICNTKRKNSVLWYRHAHKCHIYDKPKPKTSQQSNSMSQPNV